MPGKVMNNLKLSPVRNYKCVKFFFVSLTERASRIIQLLCNGTKSYYFVVKTILSHLIRCRSIRVFMVFALIWTGRKQYAIGRQI